ncbi:MAG: RidA family protein [Deltaproteobacteria bacterium]|nr:RidA family protein [Deltaproteobacteria bacterium]
MIFQWLGREFAALSAEGRADSTAAEQAADVFRRFDEELRLMGISLDDTVRTRLWARDRESRDAGSKERVRILSGKARSASSSYIAPAHFDSNATVAVDLLAMRPSRPGIGKILKEYDPPIVPLRYLIYDAVVFLSGVTAVLPSLADQLTDILPRISSSLADAGSSWDKAVKVSFYLHQSQSIDSLKELFQKTVTVQVPQMEYSFVDGYSADGKLIEVEVTATV